MKYFTALPLAATLASAQMAMEAVPAPPATGPTIHTVSTLLAWLGVELLLMPDRSLSVE